MNVRNLFVASLLPLAACTSSLAQVGDDNSRLGDLLEGDALGLYIDAGQFGGSGPTFEVSLDNTTQSGGCLGLTGGLTATANGVPATINAGFIDPGDEFGPKTVCPDLEWPSADQLGDTIDVVLTDTTRPAGDPYRSVSFTVKNPVIGNITWNSSTDDSVVHSVHAGDTIQLQMPDETVDSATFDITPMPSCTWSGNDETCTFYNPIAQGDATVSPGVLEIVVPANASGSQVLHVGTEGTEPVTGCAHATCNDVDTFRDGAFTLLVQ